MANEQDSKKALRALTETYAIYATPSAVYAAIKNERDEQKLIQDMEGKVRAVRVSGRILNQVAFRTHIDILKRRGYDSSRAEEVLQTLETTAAQRGLSKVMEDFRMTGLLIGPFEKGQVFPTHIFPSDMSGKVVHFVVPDFDGPGQDRYYSIKMPEKKKSEEPKGSPSDPSPS